MVSIDYIYRTHIWTWLTIDSELSSIDENNAKHYSKEIVRELRGLDNFIGSSEENGYYVCLTKKDIRDYTLFDESKREPDEKIYIDKAGKIIENLSEKTK